MKFPKSKSTDPRSKIAIDELLDIIIVEHSDGKVIFEDSHLYCGICGHSLGILKTELTYPFDSKQLRKSIKSARYQTLPAGIKHITCGETLFSFQKEWSFITYEDYLKDKPQA